jgi:hypothetical protein
MQNSALERPTNIASWEMCINAATVLNCAVVPSEKNFFHRLSKKYSNIMKILSVEAELFHAETGRQTDGHNEANSRLWQFWERA